MANEHESKTNKTISIASYLPTLSDTDKYLKIFKTEKKVCGFSSLSALPENQSQPLYKYQSTHTREENLAHLF